MPPRIDRMSHLSGFLGDANDRLLAHLRETLQHRGQGEVQQACLHGGSLQWQGLWAKEPRTAAGGASFVEGVACEGALAVGWAGFLTNAAELQKAWDGEDLGASGASDSGLRGEEIRLGLEVGPRLFLRLYQKEGLAFLKRLRGAFVGAIVERDVLHLFRDGAGARTMYLGRHEGRWVFAIEPKGIWGLPGFSRRLRPQALAEYLTFSFIPGEQTMLEGIEEIRAGEILTLTKEGSPHRQRFFFFPHEEAAPLSFLAEIPPTGASADAEDAFWLRAFSSTFTKAVGERLALLSPDEPLGVALSGGIDSSVVACELTRQVSDPRQVHSIAIHFGEKYPNELAFARQVAERCKTTHEEICIRPKHILEEIREMVWALDDPIGDPVTIANYELARLLSKRFSHLFNGEGGDPAFGGPKNLPMMLQHWYGGIPRSPTFLEEAYLGSFRRAYEEIPHLLSPALLGAFAYPGDLVRLVQPFLQEASSKKLLHRLTAMNLRLKGAHLILPKVERMLGRHAIVPLSPLFDERLLQMSFALPPRLILAQGIEKVILKRAYRDLLPAAIIERPKSGMRVPVHFWFQDEMRRYIRSIFSPSAVKKAGVFQPERIQKLLDYDLDAPQGRYGIRLWMLLTFEIWRRLVLEGEAL